MKEFRADLHCHTNCSDGTVTPEEIIRLALSKDLKGLSITDHDTIAAYKNAIPLAEQYYLPLVSGVEFSAAHFAQSVHILAYSFPLNSSIIEDFCAKHSQRRTKRNREILDRLAHQGMFITEEEIQNIESPHTVGRPHIALAMVKHGYVSSIQDAFSRYIGEGKSCYAPGGYFSVEETIELIHQAKGLAVIAHPHLINDSNLVNTLLEMPFDGIEGYYARFLSDQQEKWVKIGQRKGWIITGGSDFHGEIKPTNLGSSWVNEETFNILYDYFKKNQDS